MKIEQPERPLRPIPDRRPPGIDDAEQRHYRNMLGQYATGVAVITAVGDSGVRVGVTCNTFTSVSLDPPLILWSVANTSPSGRAFVEKRAFAVNILAADQKDLALKFAKSGEAKFAGLAWHEGLDGAPLLDGCVAYVECRVESRYPAGDHVIVVGAVERYINMEREPLLFHSGEFRRLS